MSRGLGKTQRRIMAAIDGKPDGHWTDLYDLAPDGERAEIESLRRAVKTLEARGLVETGKINMGWSAPADRLRPSNRHPDPHWGGHQHRGRWNPLMLGFRLPASPEFQLAEAEHQLKQFMVFRSLGLITNTGAHTEQVRELSDKITALKEQIGMTGGNET